MSVQYLYLQYKKMHIRTMWTKPVYVLLSHSPICPQLEGRAPVASSVVVTVHASQENTDVTVWRTAQMDLMRETAVSILQGGFPFFVFKAPVAF